MAKLWVFVNFKVLSKYVKLICKMKLWVNELQKEAVAGRCSEKKCSSKFHKIHWKCKKKQKLMKVVNIERENLWAVSMKFSGKMWLNNKS